MNIFCTSKIFQVLKSQFLRVAFPKRRNVEIFFFSVQAADAAGGDFSIGRMFPELLPCDGGTPCNITSGDLESRWEKTRNLNPVESLGYRSIEKKGVFTWSFYTGDMTPNFGNGPWWFLLSTRTHAQTHMYMYIYIHRDMYLHIYKLI